MSRRWVVPLVLAVLGLQQCCIAAESASPLQFRGYYMTFMRMPVMGLPEWKEMIDCIYEDGGNTLLVWMGGGFRSKKFPITWNYNQDHKNVKRDFARKLIDYAHTREIKVLLAFTPFGYDGVNQYALEHPELKAKKADGKAVDAFGIHCWGWSLCPSQPASQEFMLEYAREMAFDFYPNADGVLLESSDYNVCRCSECGPAYYQREFAFVRRFSDELWARKPNAMILVYPHYFTGKKANAGTAIEAEAARFPFDPRWTLFFTPHSAHIDPDLLKQARTSIFSDDGPSLGTPASIAQGVRTTLERGISGYVPSFEPMCYITPPQEAREGQPAGKRLKPLGFDWLPDGAMPLRELSVRLQRFAYREFTHDPKLSPPAFRKKIAVEFFNNPEAAREADDLLFLQECVNYGRGWTHSSPLVQPELLKAAARRENWPLERLGTYEDRLQRLREIGTRYQQAKTSPEKEMQRIVLFILDRWKGIDLRNITN